MIVDMQLPERALDAYLPVHQQHAMDVFIQLPSVLPERHSRMQYV
jgi:hypothetical protein